MSADDSPALEDGVPEVPGYTLLRTIGRGAAGTVYEARGADELGRRFAIKVFPPARRREYERELETLRAIETARAAAGSQDLVETIGAGETDAGVAHVVMAYVAGGDLRARVTAGGPLPPDQAVDVMLPVLRGLELLHGHGLVHKDVKPANVLLDEDGSARLGDFGLTRALAGAPLSSAGTPGFCAPELITGRVAEADERVDVYSAAATLYFLLTAEAPLPGRPDLFLLERRRVDRPLQDLLFRALALDPDERPASPQLLRDRLEAWKRGELRGPQRTRAPAWAGAVVAALCLGGLTYAATTRGAPALPRPTASTAPTETPSSEPSPASGTASPTSPSPPPSSPSTPPPAVIPSPATSTPTPSEAPPSPRWDGYELAWAGPQVTWRGGVLVLDGRVERPLLPAAPLARARNAAGTRLAAAGADGAAVVVDAGGQPVLKLPGVEAEAFPSLALSDTHLLRVLAFAELETRDRLELFDLAGERLAAWDGAPVATAAALFPGADDLPGVALGTPDGRLLVVDLRARAVTLELKTHADEVLGLAYDAERGWLLVLGDDRGVEDDTPRLRLKAYPAATLTDAARPQAELELPAGGQLTLPD